MRLGLTTEGAETPVRAARKEACERIRFAQLGRNSPTLDGRQMICGRGVDEWHEVRLPPSSFRAPRSGFPRFQWLTDLSTAPPVSSAPLRQTGASTTRPSRHKWTLHFWFTPRGFRPPPGPTPWESGRLTPLVISFSRHRHTPGVARAGDLASGVQDDGRLVTDTTLQVCRKRREVDG